MIEVTGELWLYPADYHCITTNGFVKNNGEAVMGRGCALEAKLRHPDLPLALGTHIKKYGNIPYLYNDDIITFPVKHNWWEKADINLIEESASFIYEFLGDDETIVIPRPGCGNGQLEWTDVKKVLDLIFTDDRFVVIDYGKNPEVGRTDA